MSNGKTAFSDTSSRSTTFTTETELAEMGFCRHRAFGGAGSEFMEHRTLDLTHPQADCVSAVRTRAIPHRRTLVQASGRSRVESCLATHRVTWARDDSHRFQMDSSFTVVDFGLVMNGVPAVRLEEETQSMETRKRASRRGNESLVRRQMRGVVASTTTIMCVMQQFSGLEKQPTVVRLMALSEMSFLIQKH